MGGGKGPKEGAFQTLVGRYRDEYGREKQLQSDDNMPASLEQKSSESGRGFMSLDFSLVAARCPAAIAVVRYTGKQRQAGSMHQLPPTLLDVPGRRHHDQAARHA